MAKPEFLATLYAAKSEVDSFQTWWDLLCSRNPSAAIDLLFRTLRRNKLIMMTDLEAECRRIADEAKGS